MQIMKKHDSKEAVLQVSIQKDKEELKICDGEIEKLPLTSLSFVPNPLWII